MGSNCRPVVGTLLTNTQVAVYRAFWTGMRLGSWGRRSNYQHLSFLFNEGECGKRPCAKRPARRKMPGRRWRRALGGQVPPGHPGATLPSPWNPGIAFPGEDRLLGPLGVSHRPSESSVAGGTSVCQIYCAFLCKSSS